MNGARSRAMLVAVSLMAAACSSGGAAQAPARPDDQQVAEGQAPDDAVATEITAPRPTPSVIEPTSSAAPPDDTVSNEPEPTLATGNDADEFGVSILLSQSGLGNGQTRPIGFAVGLANRELAFDGSPFFAGNGSLSSVLSFNGEGDLTEDLETLRTGVDDNLDVSVTDLFIGALPPALVAETTELAAERGLATVIVNHVDNGSVPRLGVRFDLSGSTDLTFAALVSAVVAAESDAIVIVGPVGDATTELVEALLLDAGAAPEIVDAPASPPSPGVLSEAREAIAGFGDRPAVVVLSQTWVAPLIATMAPVSSDPSFITTDLTFSRADAGSIEDFGGSTLTVVRRVDDARRPEQRDFFDRLFENQPEGSSTYAAQSYDAYALAAIAAAAASAADPATIRSGMVEASRGGRPCTVLAECLVLAAGGADVDYDGVSGPIDLDDDGVATAAWFSIDLVDPVTGGDSSSRFVLQRSN